MVSQAEIIFLFPPFSVFKLLLGVLVFVAAVLIGTAGDSDCLVSENYSEIKP